MKCGPDECPIVAFSDLTPVEQREQRARKARDLYERGFTEQQIAKQFGVTHKTISNDLREFVPEVQIKKAKTATNPKGAGRPKGSSSKERRKNERPEAVAAARDIVDGKKTYPETEKETGFSNIVLRAAVAREEGRREAEPIVTREMLSVSAQQKFDAAIRSHTARLNKQFEQRVNDEVRSRIAAADDAARAQNKELRKEVDFLRRIVHNRAVFTLEQFRQMQMLCHPDSSASEKTKAQLSQLLAENKIKLVKDMSHA